MPTTMEPLPFTLADKPSNLAICVGCAFRQKKCAGRDCCQCTVDGKGVREHAQDGDCPKGFYDKPDLRPKRKADRAEPLPEELQLLRSLWTELHTYAITSKGSAQKASNWLNGFRKRILCGTCRSGFDEYRKANPPKGDLFKWTWDYHNSVNSKLGKPLMPLDEARRLYAK